MTVNRLNAESPLSEDVELPGYDRRSLKPGIVHIGVGAFHRAHQAVYTDDALASVFGDWGIISVSLRSKDIVNSLKDQDYLHSVTIRDQSAAKIKLVGSTIGAIAAAENGEAVLLKLSDPAIRVVTLTVSEKAYGLDPKTGSLDTAHSAVAHDLVDPESPVGVIGYLTEGLARRRAAGHQPYTVLCCDNLPRNGHVVRRLVLEMAYRRDAHLAKWIEEEGCFPSSMVDRIVPAATQEVRERATEALGVWDELALETEPFRQWIIEDDFVSGRPAWDAGGALFVSAVEPYEKMKLRLLNGSHSMIAYLGQLRGLEYVRDVMAVPEYREIVRRHMQAAKLTLDPVPGIDVDSYMEELIARFANPEIAHRTAQIAMDGTQKLPQRIFAAAVDALAAGSDGDQFAYVTALWMAYVTRFEKIDDPRGREVRQAALAGEGSSASLFAVPGLFPPELEESHDWRGKVDAHLKQIFAG